LPTRSASVHLKDVSPFISFGHGHWMRTARNTPHRSPRRTRGTKAVMSGAVAMIAIVAMSSSASAGAELVVNGGFEASPIPAGSVSAATKTLAGWTVTQGDIDIINWNGTGGRWSAHSGQQSIDLNGCQMGAIKQKITTIPGMVYEMSYWIAPSTESAGMKRIGARVGTAPGRTDLAYQITYRDSSTATPGNMGWVNQTVTFVATESFAWIYFDDYSQDGCFGMALDDVSVKAKDSVVVSVPQFDPNAVVALTLAAGSAALMTSQRRRTRRLAA
jgi:choice-of-anchor C domain-containing protein